MVTWAISSLELSLRSREECDEDSSSSITIASPEDRPGPGGGEERNERRGGRSDVKEGEEYE